MNEAIRNRPHSHYIRLSADRQTPQYRTYTLREERQTLKSASHCGLLTDNTLIYTGDTQ
jgi:hypothetical protein